LLYFQALPAAAAEVVFDTYLLTSMNMSHKKSCNAEAATVKIHGLGLLAKVHKGVTEVTHLTSDGHLQTIKSITTHPKNLKSSLHKKSYVFNQGGPLSNDHESRWIIYPKSRMQEPAARPAP
jgi:hypothetical protein